MSIESWKEEFYRADLCHAPTLHAIVKWKGLRKENLERHSVYHDWMTIWDDEGNDFSVSTITCRLCNIYYRKDSKSCINCPLHTYLEEDCDREEQVYAYWKNTGDPEPMIKALQESVPIVLYHANCKDGFCAAWVLSKVFPRADFHAIQYGNPCPDIENRIVFIVDFSFPREEMLRICEQARHVHVFDHHKSAKKELEGLSHPKLTMIFDMERSGGQIVWDYFFIGERPWLVDYTGDRDLWKFQLPNSRAVNEGIEIPENNEQGLPDFASWYSLIFEDVAQKGAMILKYNETKIKKIINEKRYSEGVIHSQRCRITNCTDSALISDLGNALAKDDYIGITFMKICTDGDWHYIYSLRSIGDIDVSVIAKVFGGGGHKNAAGFRSKEWIFATC